ncbi:damage-inducible protein DinB [Brachyspira pilosicoli]|uniref:Damage-inducible protein DinB n=1 Tax=Brachyspira pilosicoli TaxID=52584 RepID=A0AAJ6KBD9_BRAPL|nr:DinB family protein [Brachyspira pilosicoli]WIH89907.1 damage-inducible protein DinB [Brachyspira pilosicoli]WIH92202.1 damage-inducible protein DinB [Brachyspira pilosicoli]WIH94431.1 damage-inducible protein DinB [Brachyspira pilosicoli]
MIDHKINLLEKKINSELNRLNKKSEEIDILKSSIISNLNKNLKELKSKKLKQLREEKKLIYDNLLELRNDFSEIKKEYKKTKKNNQKKSEISENIIKTITSQRVLTLMAEYNRKANRMLISIFRDIQKINESDLYKETGSYFNSLINSFTHIIKTDIYFFSILRKYSSKKIIANEEILTYLNDNFLFNKPIDANLDTLFDTRKKLDDIIIDVINSIDDYNVIIKIDFADDTIKKPIYHIIMHELNHNTHHRGEISAMLDMMGYVNDYSNLITII